MVTPEIPVYLTLTVASPELEIVKVLLQELPLFSLGSIEVTIMVSESSGIDDAWIGSVKVVRIVMITNNADMIFFIIFSLFFT